MWPEHVPRPSEQLEDLLRGKIAWDDAPQSIRSWAQLQIYQAAKQIAAAPDKGTRRNMLGRVPAPIRPRVENEVKRQWANRIPPPRPRPS